MGIAPIGEKYGVRIFPNPAKDYIIIEQDDDKKMQIIIYNIQGVVIDTFGIDNIIYKHSVVNYQPGLYTLLLMNYNETIIKKYL